MASNWFAAGHRIGDRIRIMNPRVNLLVFLIFAISCSVGFPQNPVSEQASQIQNEVQEDIKQLKALHEAIAMMLKSANGPTEIHVRSGAVGARLIALRLQRNLALSTTAEVLEKQAETLAVSPRDTLRSLETLLIDLINSPILGPAVAGSDSERTRNVAKHINALIEFTEPLQLEFGKRNPLDIRTLMDLLLTGDKEKTIEVIEPKVVKLVRQRCVDFIDNGTNFWALRTVGASENIMKEIDTCLSAESRSVVLNRLAATPESEQTVEKASVFGEVIRFFFTKKDLAGRKRFLEASREFIRRFGDELCAVELVDWLKVTIPKVETTIQKMAASK